MSMEHEEGTLNYTCFVLLQIWNGIQQGHSHGLASFLRVFSDEHEV